MGLHQFFKSTFDATCYVTPSTFRCVFSDFWVHRVVRFLLPIVPGLLPFLVITLFEDSRRVLFEGDEILVGLILLAFIFFSAKSSFLAERHFVDLSVENHVVSLSHRNFFEVLNVQFHMDEVDYFLKDSIFFSDGGRIQFFLIDKTKPTESTEANEKTFNDFFENLIAENSRAEIEEECLVKKESPSVQVQRSIKDYVSQEH